MTIETGALEQAYADLEASYNRDTGRGPGVHGRDPDLELSLSGKTNREPSPEKRGTPDEAQSLPRRFTARLEPVFDHVGTVRHPGDGIERGEADEGRHGGPAHAGGLATTVAAMPAATATSCTLTSVVGLAVGDIIVFTMATGARQVTRIKTLAGRPSPSTP
jgi:hypothetical protein